jgi:predicted ArsR family transcriptional regulator
MMDPRVVEDVETLKAMADPARLAILELAMSDYARAWTAKELAVAIGMSPKKIYYHLGLLEQRGLLQIRSTQVVNGIIEKHYGASQRSITFQHGSGLPPGPDSFSDMGEMAALLFDKVRNNFLDGLRSGRAVMDRQASDSQRAVVSYSTAAMPPEKAGRFRDALLQLVTEFDAAGIPGEPTFELLIAIHPREGAADPQQTAPSP